MKKKIFSTLLMTALMTAILLTGCGSEKTEDNNKSTNEQLEDSQDTTNESFEDITWTWSIENYDLYRMMVERKEVDPKLFLGIVTYTDGTMGSIEADEVELSQDRDNMIVSVEYRGSDFVYTVPILEIWGDGEQLTEEEIEEFKQQEQSGDSTSAVVGKGVIKDKNLELLVKDVTDTLKANKHYSWYGDLEDLLEYLGDEGIPMFSSEQDFYDFYDKYVILGYLEPRDGYTEEELKELAKKSEEQESSNGVSVVGKLGDRSDDASVVLDHNKKVLFDDIKGIDEERAGLNWLRWYNDLEDLLAILRVDMPMFSSEAEFYEFYDSYAVKPEDVAHFDNMEDLHAFLDSAYGKTHVYSRNEEERGNISTGAYSNISFEDRMSYFNSKN